jgi:hypothetical protein
MICQAQPATHSYGAIFALGAINIGAGVMTIWGVFAFLQTYNVTIYNRQDAEYYAKQRNISIFVMSSGLIVLLCNTIFFTVLNQRT